MAADPAPWNVLREKRQETAISGFWLGMPRLALHARLLDPVALTFFDC